MKLQGVIIVNRLNLGNFFDFKEFMGKRREFINTMNKRIFFESDDCNASQLFEVVKMWISGTLPGMLNLKVGINLDKDKISINNRCINLQRTAACQDILKDLDLPDRIGITALYEMIDRDLKQDLEAVLSYYKKDWIDFSSNFINLGGDDEREYDFPSIENANANGCASPLVLRNVLIVNGEGSGSARIKAGEQSIKLEGGECCRAIFIGEKCVRILPRILRLEGKQLTLCLTGKQSTGLKEEPTLCNDYNILSAAISPKGNIFITDNTSFPILSFHRDISIIGSPLNKNERALWITTSATGKKAAVLTSAGRVLEFDKDGSRQASDNALFAEYDKEKLNILERN